MQRFVLQSNIERHAKLLAAEVDPVVQNFLRRQLAAWRRDLALLEADLHGVAIQPLSPGSQVRKDWSDFQKLYEGVSTPTLLLHPGVGLHIVDLNDAYAQATNINWRTSAGERLFDVFPDNPDNPEAGGVSNLHTSLITVSKTGRTHAMAIQRYDIRVDGIFVERHWQPLNTPIFDTHGRLSYIVHQVHDVTAAVRSRRTDTLE